MTTGGIPRFGGSAAAPMLRRFESLKSYTIGAADGDIGTLHDLYFDDRSWTVRYLIVDTGGWLSGRLVLLPPRAVTGIEPEGRQLTTSLTKQQVEDSPTIDTAKPVARQHEIDLYRYYGYPYYWAGPYRWGPMPYPAGPLPLGDDAATAPRATDSSSGDAHLRSMREVTGYGIKATDGELGHVEDFLVGDDAWAIRYLIVDPRNWWPGKHVLMSIEWVTAVHWRERTVEVNVSKEKVRSAPAYDPSGWVDREYETRFHGYYGRPGYWERPPEKWTLLPPAA